MHYINTLVCIQWRVSKIKIKIQDYCNKKCNMVLIINQKHYCKIHYKNNDINFYLKEEQSVILKFRIIQN